MNKLVLLITIICLCCVIGGTVLLYQQQGVNLLPKPGAAWTPENQRELAAKLKSAGLTHQAIAAYEHYAQSADLDRPTYGTLCYTIGKMYLDAGDYEKALAWLYRVEIADPSTSLKNDTGSAIITCLERLGKYSAAEHALSRRTSPDQKRERPEGTVIAEISGDKIYAEDVSEALDRLPPWMRSQFDSQQSRREFAKKYIADELLYRKALKLGYDKDPELLKKKKDIERELLVTKLIEHDVHDNMTIDEYDVKTYFEAHRPEYEDKEAVKVSLIKVDEKEAAEKIIREVTAGKDFHQLARDRSRDTATAPHGGRFPGWVRKGENDLGIGNEAEISAALFGKKPGDIIGPVPVGTAWYVFRIEENRPARMPSYDEVKDRVKKDYALRKAQARYQSLLEQTLKSAEVKLYLERFETTTKK